MNPVLKDKKQPSNHQNDSEKYLCDYCGHLLGAKDTFRRHRMITHHDKTKEHQCSICGYSTARLDSIRRHLKSNHHSKRARYVTKYITDFPNSPRERFPFETRPYQVEPSTRESYIYQQTMPKNKEMFPQILHSLDVPLIPQKVYKPHYILVKEPINIPYDSVEQLEDPRLNYYSPRSSSTSHYNDCISELDTMVQRELETDVLEKNINPQRFHPWYNPGIT